MDPDESWGQLVSLTEFDSEPIILNKSTFQIGRADGKHFSLYIIRTNCIRIGIFESKTNKFVSMSTRVK